MPGRRASERSWNTLWRLRRLQAEQLAAELAALRARERQTLGQVQRLDNQLAELPTARTAGSIQELCRTDQRRQALHRQRDVCLGQHRQLARQSAALQQQLVAARRAVMQMERLAKASGS